MKALEALRARNYEALFGFYQLQNIPHAQLFSKFISKVYAL
jgi:hypothetical protein